ncbi:bifunctional hydroxymethylpyrimidine kinase/phosphomethylpyrimidine kinase [Gracilibacillus alcaliphilus]|uniref:bifunctional hydroxymethylpyrimidine kinase/phosphomethylpyrimidine kinase n=1 Tax=Gracilibacillus alcaliphilus TaxID=1401441 RepID=UPI00195DF557|nr:bifunctional hydroxymethylpyrimidine kinase/phosphomethylpyrimidine kinase [Gracilibacillus alcaliphilus]MBM7679658.1 pyridoxine kinase/hydroxymethylpyrimidine/phosphomethylpyrimidine kinase [Gracilibacillus alcaliphilus]
MKRVLTIAGAAAQGSAGIQADLKTFQERDVYGMSVITAIVANNSHTEKGIFIHPIEEIKAQFYAATEMVGVDAVKLGMLFSAEIIGTVSRLLRELNPPFLVVDPVMIGKMGSQLLADDAIEVMKEQILPQATVITPNRLEAEQLLGRKIPDQLEALEQAAIDLYRYQPQSVLLKAGIVDGTAIDLFYDGKSIEKFSTEGIDTIHTSGAGCTYAACLTAELAKGVPIHKAIQKSKQFVHAAIKHALFFNRGIGSVRHGALRQKNIEEK